MVRTPHRWSTNGSAFAKVVTVVLAMLLMGAGVGSFASPVLAQNASGGALGITVIGYGEASVPAEMATLQFVIMFEDFYGPRSRPRAGAIPGEEEREAVAPIVETLTANGVASDEIEVGVYRDQSGFHGVPGLMTPRLDVALDQPSLQQINTIVDTANQAIVEEGLVLIHVGVGYEISDCEPLWRQAREAAIADARGQAEVQAELLGVQVGSVVASADLPATPDLGFGYFGPVPVASNGCAPPIATIFSGSPITLPAFDQTAPAEVDVYAQVSLTFEIVS